MLCIFAVVILAEIVILFSLKFSSKSIMDNSEIVGNINKTDSRVNINNIRVPSYGYNNKVYIAAEDLIPFGAELINSNSKNSDLTIEFTMEISENINKGSFSKLNPGETLARPEFSVYLKGRKTKENFYCGGYNIIPVEALNPAFDSIKNTYNCTIKTDNSDNIIEGSKKANNFIGSSLTQKSSPKKIIVLDAGHGKSSGKMSVDEKKASGWVYNETKKQWGEWRHFKSGSATENCFGTGCNGRVTPNGSCWYPISNGDRDTEPDINLKNCISAKKYLEEMGYTVRMTRTTNEENPSVTQRLSYCYPDKNTSASPDAEMFICIHSNAGGGSGSAYIGLSGEYDQKNIPSDYTDKSNALAKSINDEIVSSTPIKIHGNGKITGMDALIAFCKSPVACAYLEVGFYDNQNDLSVLQNEYDAIGKAIALGIDKYINE